MQSHFVVKPNRCVVLCWVGVLTTVLKASDRRIRTLIAKTTTNKMLLDTSISELDKMAKRHEEYQLAAEPAEMLVDTAYTIKSKLREAEKVEKQLISDFGNLTLLLEMLNLDGEEEDKKRGTELGNKVTADLAKYKGLVNEFAHDKFTTIKCTVQQK